MTSPIAGKPRPISAAVTFRFANLVKASAR